MKSCIHRSCALRSCPVVASYGARDPAFASYAPKLEHELTRLGVPHDVKVYPEAGHGFLNNHPPEDMTPLLVVLNRISGTRYHEPSAQDAR